MMINDLIFKKYIDMSDKEKALFGFEHLCGSCDYFETNNCPHKDKVKEDTLWSEKDNGIGCDNFWD